MRLICSIALLAMSAGASDAATIYADVVLDYHHSGSQVFDAGNGYGGPPNASEVPLSYAIDDDPTTFISLPTGSYITLGFSTGYIFDGAGDDLFVDETGAASERADLFVSSDFGQSFTWLTVINGNQTNSIDFADYSYTGNVNALKIVGLDNNGASPGFDLTGAWGLDGSTVEEPQNPAPVPVPASLPLLMSGGVLLGALRRRQRQR